MKLNNFAGGLNINLDPTLLEATEALVYSNIDSAKGALHSINNYTKQGKKLGRWFHKFNSVWYSSINNREYLEYRGALYWTERDNHPKKVVFGIEKKLGISPPSNALTSVINATGTIITGTSVTIQYAYTFYDSTEGVESPPSLFSTELVLDAGESVDLSGFQTSPNTAVDKIRLYRVGALTTDFTLIATLANGTATYNDNISPLDAPGDILESYLYSPPQLGIRYLTEAYGILFAALGNTLVYSAIGLPDAWPAGNTIPVSGDITGLYAVSDGLVIFTKSKTHLLLGSSPETFHLITLSPEHGCLDHLSLAYVRNSLMWISAQGLALLVGGGITIATKDKLGLIKFNPIKAVSYDEQYWLTLEDGSIFIADFRTGRPVFKYCNFTLANVYNLGVFDNILYGVIDEELVTMHTGEPIALSYTSPRLTEGNATVSKLYNNVYVRADGEFILDIVIDGKKVSSNKLVGDKLHDISVPQEDQRGTDIQFVINGVGVVREIEYKVVGRENGR